MRVCIFLYKSESLSSALYFASSKSAPFTETVVTIDIGGHTSDISIWQDRKLLWRNSMQIAGRHILINFLNENPKFIDVLAKNNTKLDITIANMKLYCDYIYLDSEERKVFSSREHEYLIEQLQYGEKTSIPKTKTEIDVELLFRYPVKELYFQSVKVK